MYFYVGRMPGFVLVFVFMLTIAWTPFSQAATRAPLTLAEAEDLALRDEPGQQALEARAAALREQAVVAGELPDPTLRVGVNNFPIESGGFSTEGMTQATFGFRQAFPAGKTRALSHEKLGLMSDSVSENASARGRNVLTATRRAWLDLYSLDRSYELVAESRPFFADLAEITRSLYAVGRKTQQDVLRAELELSRLDDRLIDIERRQARAKAALAEWIGSDAERPVANKLPPWESLPALETLRHGLLQHPSMRAAEAEVAASETGVRIADERAKPRWALDIGYGYREGRLPSGETRSDMVTVGVTVDLPFVRKRSVDSTLSAALREQSAANASKLRLQRELERQLATEYAEWRDLSRRLTLFDEQILRQADDQAQAALLAYRSDAGDFADVMRAYIGHLNTRIDHIRLQVQRAQSYAAIANLGGLSP